MESVGVGRYMFRKELRRIQSKRRQHFPILSARFKITATIAEKASGLFKLISPWLEIFSDNDIRSRKLILLEVESGSGVIRNLCRD